MNRIEILLIHVNASSIWYIFFWMVSSIWFSLLWVRKPQPLILHRPLYRHRPTNFPFPFTFIQHKTGSSYQCLLWSTHYLYLCCGPSPIISMVKMTTTRSPHFRIEALRYYAILWVEDHIVPTKAKQNPVLIRYGCLNEVAWVRVSKK